MRGLSRREFVTAAAMAATGMIGLPPRPGPVVASEAGEPLLSMEPTALSGGCARVSGDRIVPGASWYEARAPGDGLVFAFVPGTLARGRFLTCDILVDGSDLVVFELLLHEPGGGAPFRLVYGVLPHAEARLRMRAEAVTQNRWQFPREGAWLKPSVGGARVELARVDRLSVRVHLMGPTRVRWCQTAISVSLHEPPRLAQARLPKGPILDELGQSRLRTWPTRTRNERQLWRRLNDQRRWAASWQWPSSYSRWGGWSTQRFEPRGFFHTVHDGMRWWLVDPDGHPFWSTGVTSVAVDPGANYDGLAHALSWIPDRDGPFKEIFRATRDGQPQISYVAANFIRALGRTWRDDWNAIVVGELRRLGFNTMGNWSDWRVASRAGFPYVRQLTLGPGSAPLVFRDFPDVFDARFEQDATRFARQLESSHADPALVGYFLMNEPTWGFAGMTPAAGMLFNTEQCASRHALRAHLADRYASDAALSSAWGMETTLDTVAAGPWTQRLTPAAERDLMGFSTAMVDRFFRVLDTACRRVAPSHLNLGVRHYTVPPRWMVEGMGAFDVVTVNCYEPSVRADAMAQIAATLRKPVLVGEWHFGSLDAGLPATGIGHVPTQADRGRAFRVYVEDAASRPWCIGTHYFRFYDQSALGRFDGECCNIGLYDVCNRPYEPLARAARATHDRLYEAATGAVSPFADAPEYLPNLFP